MFRKQKLKKIIDHYGKELQSSKAIRKLNIFLKQWPDRDKLEDKYDLFESVAEAEIALEQLKIIFKDFNNLRLPDSLFVEYSVPKLKLIKRVYSDQKSYAQIRQIKKHKINAQLDRIDDSRNGALSLGLETV